MKLTDLAVKALSVESGRRTFFDDSIKGFGLRVTPSSKTFVLVVHRRNRNEWERIGTYPILTLAKAREAARNRLATIQLRQDHEAPSLTFEEAFDLFRRTYTRPKNRPKTAKETERLITKHFLPKLSRHDLTDITTHEIAQLVEKLLPKPGSAFHAHAAARLMFRWAARRRLIPRNPMEYLDPPVRMMSRERVLTDDELRQIYRAAEDGSTFGKIVRLLILTGQRRSQVARLRPEFIDETNALLTWPADEMKGHRPHSMPLAPTAADILSARPEAGYLFPARGKDTAFNGFSKAKIDFDKRVPTVEPWVLHDLRRTFSTGIAKLRIPPHIKEMLLAHASAKSPVEAIYDRYSYADEMREALEKWERHLVALLERE